MTDPIFLTPATNALGLANVGLSASPALVDIDGDGDLDAFVGTNNGNTQFFRNTGIATSPSFSAEANNFGLANVGYSASPAFADIDKDGDWDAFVGNQSGDTRFFRNVGTSTAPSFSAETGNFGLANVGMNASPALADIDGDGDFDAFVGNYDGDTLFFRNSGTDSSPSFVAGASNFGIGNAGLYAANPTLADLDGDGDLDVVLGAGNGSLLLFRNTGTVNAANFEAASGLLGIGNAGYFAKPSFADIDGDGDLDALVGNAAGETLLFLNAASNTRAPVLAAPAAINYTDTAFDDVFAVAQGALLASDGDQNLLSYGLDQGTDNGDGTVSKGSAYGVLTLTKATGAYRFVPDDGEVEALSANASASFTLTVTDGVFSDSKTLSINLSQEGLTETMGNDTLAGTDANDKISALGGNDRIDGLKGADTMLGGLGNDTYFVDHIGDSVTEGSAAGIDTVNSSVRYALGDNLENLNLIGSAANGTGNGLGNVMNGNSGANILNGGAGDDRLNGGAGADMLVGGAGGDALNGGVGADALFGGAGNDVYVVDNTADSVTETSSLPAEKDKVYSSVSFSLGANLEWLELTGTTAVNGAGNALNNLLSGNSAANTLDGGAGNDVLTGGAGKDTFLLDTFSKDTITDFSVPNDTVALENTVFTKLSAAGVLNAANFRLGPGAGDSNDFVVYNGSTGALLYDADGNGAGAGVQIAVLGLHLPLTNFDFAVV